MAATRPSPEQRKALTRRFQHVLNSIGDGAARRLQPAWNALPSYDETDIPTFTSKAAPILTAAKSAAIHHAAAFYTLTAGIAPIGITVAAVTIQPDLREPFISVWQALKSGRPYDEAVNAGSLRIDAVAGDLVESSARLTGDAVVEKAGLRIVGWERIPDDTACPYCEEIAPGFYSSAESADAPSHNNCGCSVEPIFADANT